MDWFRKPFRKLLLRTQNRREHIVKIDPRIGCEGTSIECQRVPPCDD